GLQGTPPMRHSPPRGTPPHQRPEPVLRLHRALRPRGVGRGEHAPGCSLRDRRARGGGLCGRLRLPAPAPEQGGGFLDLQQTPAPGARPRPTHHLRCSPRLVSSPRSPRYPVPYDALDGSGERRGRRDHPRLEGQCPLRGRRACRHSRPPRPRPAGVALCPRPPGGPLGARHDGSPYPGASPRGRRRRCGLRGGVSGV
ncbi:MAG: hypothetical protein AVDCRST_MAG78-3127, partial [uncultured Rubrobacteraceae bacterium]